MTVEYRIARRARACMKCERPFAEGALIVSEIRPEGEGFLRRDLCEACFDRASDAYSHWRARQPRTDAEREILDLDLAGEFLGRLAKENDPARAPLAYMLALLLARKRRVKLEPTAPGESAGIQRVILRGDESDETLELPVPVLGEPETLAVQAELQRLFGGGEPDAERGAKAAPAATP